MKTRSTLGELNLPLVDIFKKPQILPLESNHVDLQLHLSLIVDPTPCPYSQRQQ